MTSFCSERSSRSQPIMCVVQACNSNDYEPWRPLKPQDGSPAPCLLGRELSMQRRKRDSACFNGQDWLTEGHMQTCPCGQVQDPPSALIPKW